MAIKPAGFIHSQICGQFTKTHWSDQEQEGHIGNLIELTHGVSRAYIARELDNLNECEKSRADTDPQHFVADDKPPLSRCLPEHGFLSTCH